MRSSIRIRMALGSIVLTLGTWPLAAQAEGPRAVDAPVEAVVVYPSGATVVRRLAEPAADGALVFRDLPLILDRDSVRVRAEGGEIAAVEVREREVERLPTERLAALRATVAERRLALAELEVEANAREALRAAQGAILERLVGEHRADLSRQTVGVADGGADPRARWDARVEWLRTLLRDRHERARGLDARIEAAQAALAETQAALGGEDRARAQVLDVHVELVTSDRARLELEYFVQAAGWEPAYDVRVSKDLRRAELVHDANVWQESGEDWPDVRVALSTAEPQRGTRVDAPPPRWISVYDPRQPRVAASERAAANDMTLDALGYSGGEAAPAEAAPFATVSDEGLSVRLQLPARETVESRSEPVRVLVGRAPLDLDPERVCVPAVDPTVYLRGRGLNSTPWILFRGETAVYVGADFVGRGFLETTRVGQELVLDLGADPALAVERVVLVDRNEAPGLLSRRRTWRQDWRVRFQNDGAASLRTDGAVTVVVHEAIPRATDERIRAELVQAEPASSGSSRWKELREEEGVLTWELTIPRGASRRIELATEVSYPVGEQLTVR